MEKELRGQALHTHCEMAVLRLLVEAVITAMPLEAQENAAQAFAQNCERVTADLLASSGRDELLAAMKRAMGWQRRRLASLDLYLPDPDE